MERGRLHIRPVEERPSPSCIYTGLRHLKELRAVNVRHGREGEGQFTWCGKKHRCSQAGGARDFIPTLDGGLPGAAEHARKLAHAVDLALRAAHIRKDVVDVDPSVAKAALLLRVVEVVIA